MIKFIGEYESFADAMASEQVSTYEDPAVIAARLYKAREHYAKGTQHRLLAAGEESTRLFSWIASSGLPRQLRVLDFGGGLGPGYAVAQRSPLARAELLWAAIDMPACVKSAKQFETPNLKFFDSIDAGIGWLKGVDIVYVNSVLQYLQSPESTLQRLLDAQPQWVVLMRTVIGPRRCVQIMESPLSWEYAGKLPESIPDRTMRNICTTMAYPVLQKIMADNGYDIAIGQCSSTVAWFQRDQFLYKKVR